MSLFLRSRRGPARRGGALRGGQALLQAGLALVRRLLRLGGRLCAGLQSGARRLRLWRRARLRRDAARLAEIVRCAVAASAACRRVACLAGARLGGWLSRALLTLTCARRARLRGAALSLALRRLSPDGSALPAAAGPDGCSDPAGRAGRFGRCGCWPVPCSDAIAVAAAAAPVAECG